jgi:capsular polysaccharide biosynthesis protein
MKIFYLSLSLIFCINSVYALQHPNGFTTTQSEQNSILFLLSESDSHQFVLSLDHGAVINEGGIITKEGKILKDTETYLEDQHRLLKSGRNILDDEMRIFEGKLAVISSPGQENWYHWLLQVLPRLKILADSEIPYDKIYINHLQYPWQKESLTIVLNELHIPQEKLLLVEGDVIIEAQTLIVPSVPFIPSKGTPLPEWLKSFLSHCFLKANHLIQTPEKIYISRAHASTRRIINEAELIQFLEKEKFVICHLENLSIHEQAHLFHNAKIIIGPHGSGFANLIFCKPETQIIEIDHGLKEDQRSFYKKLAHTLSCNYFPFYADEVDEEQLEDDIFLDLSSFIHAFSHIIMLED